MSNTGQATDGKVPTLRVSGAGAGAGESGFEIYLMAVDVVARHTTSMVHVVLPAIDDTGQASGTGWRAQPVGTIWSTRSEIGDKNTGNAIECPAKPLEIRKRDNHVRATFTPAQNDAGKLTLSITDP